MTDEDRAKFDAERTAAIAAAQAEAEARQVHLDQAQQTEANQPGPKPLKGDGKFFPVRILRGYRPAAEYKVQNPDGSFVDPAAPKLPNGTPDFEGTTIKVLPGAVIQVPLDEAKKIIKLGIAERADDIG